MDRSTKNDSAYDNALRLGISDLDRIVSEVRRRFLSRPVSMPPVEPGYRDKPDVIAEEPREYRRTA